MGQQRDSQLEGHSWAGRKLMALEFQAIGVGPQVISG